MKELKKKCAEQERIFASHTSDNELISIMCKELKKENKFKKKTNDSIEKLDRYLTEYSIKMAGK